MPPGDIGALSSALAEMGRDPEQRQTMGQAGQRRCQERWTAERMIDAYLDVLNEASADRAAERRTPRRPSRRSALAEGFLRGLDRRRWVTWERSD